MSTSGKWSTPAFPDIVVFPRGPIAELELERVAGAVGRLLNRHRVDGGARVRIVGANCSDGPQLVQVNLCIGGIRARVQTVTPGLGMVLPVVLRLERLIKRLTTKQWEAPEQEPIGRRLLEASIHGTIIRRKNCSLLVAPPDAAAAVLGAMDYDAHLFIDAETGADAIVYRGDPAGIGLLRSARDSAEPQPIPELSETAAVARLCSIGLPYLFFMDSVTRRGHLLYRRYDADLGLITPRTDPRLTGSAIDPVETGAGPMSLDLGHPGSVDSRAVPGTVGDGTGHGGSG